MMASYADWGHTAPTKLTKSRSKPAVKPILKKKGTQSAKSSLDLDRSWEEQIHFGSHGWGVGGAVKGPGASPASGALDSAVGWADGDTESSTYGGRDVSFSLPANDIDASGSGGAGVGAANTRAKYSHARSTSGASHASIATSGSGHGSYRNGSTFVHPFQQTPRTATPPLSVTNSLSFEPSQQQHQQSSSRDYSPTITEDEDLEFEAAYSYHHSRNNSYQGHSLPSQSILAAHAGTNTIIGGTTTTGNLNNNSSASSTNAPRRPSLASNRTSSLSDVNTAHRVNTNRSTSLSGGSRLAHVSSTSDLNLLTENNGSPASSSIAIGTSTPGTTAPISTSFSVSSPISPSAMSPLRTSLEGFRMRSRSDLDSSYHAERIRQERQKWQEKERAKELKREKEDLKRRDRADSKEAEALAKKEQKEAARHRSSAETEATGRPVNAGSPKFSAGYINGTSYREPYEHGKPSKTQNHRARLHHRGNQDNADSAAAEKMPFVSRNYESTNPGQAPTGAQGVSFDLPRRTITAKRKTQGAWTTFVLWFRSRVLRLQTKLEK